MRKQTLFKKVISLAVAAAMAVSVCTAALADNDETPQEGNGISLVDSGTDEELTDEQLIAAIQTLINDLPNADGVTNENLDNVNAKLAEIKTKLQKIKDKNAINNLDSAYWDKVDAVSKKVDEQLIAAIKTLIEDLPNADGVTNQNLDIVNAKLAEIKTKLQKINDYNAVDSLDSAYWDKVDAVSEKVEELKKSESVEPEVTDVVATIDNKKYASLEKAFDAVDTAGTSVEIVLQKDVTDAPKLSAINGTTVTVNLNNHSITFAEDAYFDVGGNRTLNLTGTGVVAESTAKYAPVYVTGSADYTNNKAVVNVGEGVTLQGWAGVFVDKFKYNSGIEVNIAGTLNALGDGTAVYVNGGITNVDDKAPVINIQSTAKLTSANGCGMYLAGYANTTIADGASITGTTGIEIRAGKLTVNGGTITGTAASTTVTANGNGSTTQGTGVAIAQHTSCLPIEVTINNGTITGATALNEANPQNNGSDATAKESISVVGGNFVGAISSATVNGFISGGTFSQAFNTDYVKSGYMLGQNEDKSFSVGKTPDPTPAPTATPEPTATPTATPAPTAAPVEIKPAAPVINDTALKDVTPEEKEKLVEAAESATISESKELANNETVQNVAKSADDYIAADGTVKDTLNEDIQKAADASPELKAAAANDISDITLVSAPYLAVTPQKSDDGTLVFDIKLYCALKATTDPDNMTAANTCTLKTEKVKDAPVMNITLDVSKAYSGNELNTLYVRHVTESGAVYYYKAYSKGNGIIEFTNPHGFSTFTVLSDTRVAKVKLAGKEYVYDIAGIGVEFPHPDMPGYTYKGYQFDGISGSYTTLTEELFNKLAAAGKTVSATATFSAIATPAPAATAAAPEATAAPTATPAPTPDDSQYYTCKDCGHHNWTATADGYKCDTCGRVETKQLSGYKNVKGTYTPTASAAAAKTTSAIPQTSDTMPIVPIAIVMIAALLGLGVTLYMKKKHN